MSVLAASAGIAIEPMVITAVIAGAVVLAALRMLACDLDYALRWYALHDEAQALRRRQMERLRSLRPKRR